MIPVAPGVVSITAIHPLGLLRAAESGPAEANVLKPWLEKNSRDAFRWLKFQHMIPMSLGRYFHVPSREPSAREIYSPRCDRDQHIRPDYHLGLGVDGVYLIVKPLRCITDKR